MSLRPAWSIRASSRTGSKATQKPCLELPTHKIKKKRYYWFQVVVMWLCMPLILVLRRQRDGGLQFEASLVYRESSRIVKATQKNPVSQNFLFVSYLIAFYKPISCEGSLIIQPHIRFIVHLDLSSVEGRIQHHQTVVCYLRSSTVLPSHMPIWFLCSYIYFGTFYDF